MALAILGIAWGVVGSGPALAGDERGEIVFRITLQGNVPPGDAFSLGRTSSPSEWIDSAEPICNPPDWMEDPRAQQETCSATTYVRTYYANAGARVDYMLLRDPAGDPIAFERHGTGSIVVHSGTQVVQLTYTYPAQANPAPTQAPSQPAAPAEGGAVAASGDRGPAPLLPDTAVPTAARP